MANLQSSKKRIKTNLKSQQRNVAVKTAVKTAVKKVEQAISDGDVEAARERYSEAVSVLDSAVAKGIIKKNTGSRKKSQLANNINALANAS